ncbi:EAL domain-containing protein [Sphingomonas sp. TDK1]|uniref:EAL domain-containing protein n=1 Tax=Sphingomonas sp. TDK1 TaxID=453247 RepID=UPI0007D90BC5|nr:EAL domain-containing protein [Sphingomonas sp. TDK1]OAN66065.1 diguanylate phosphodiesterase [Sphingomonas sp. TDK1]
MVLDSEDCQAAPAPGLHLAFRPVHDVITGRVFAYEAVLRGPAGEEGEEILAQLPADRHAELDRRVAAGAVYKAMEAGLGATTARLLIPIHAPHAGAAETALAAAADAGRRTGLATERLIFGIHGFADTPGQQLADLVERHRRAGALTAFLGLGYDPIGFSPCVRYRPAMVRLDSELVNGIDASWARRLMLEELAPRLREHGIRVIADGVAREAVLQRLRSFGIFHVQGDLVAPPVPGMLPPTRIPRPAATA